MATTKYYTELFKIIAGSTGKNRHLRKLVIGIIGIIGTVEYSHAETQDEIWYEVHIDELECNQNIFIDSKYNGMLFIQNLDNSQTIWQGDSFSPSDVENLYQHRIKNTQHKIDLTYGIVDFWILEKTDNRWNFKCPFITHKQHNTTDQYTINLIAETFNLELPELISDEPIEPTQTNWKERYNTCYDKKENLKTVRDTYKSELSELQSNFDILQSNLTNANFEIDKLKQEKADLIKQVETLETQLHEN